MLHQELRRGSAVGFAEPGPLQPGEHSASMPKLTGSDSQLCAWVWGHGEPWQIVCALHLSKVTPDPPPQRALPQVLPPALHSRVGHSCQVYKDVHYQVITDGQATDFRLTLFDLVLIFTQRGNRFRGVGPCQLLRRKRQGWGGPLDPAESGCPVPNPRFLFSLGSTSPAVSRRNREPTQPVRIPTDQLLLCTEQGRDQGKATGWW